MKMKLLQYTVFRSCKHQDGGPFSELCRFNIFNLSTSYAAILGILGVFLSLYDIITIITCGKILPCSIVRAGVKSVTDLLTPEVTRDFKLIGLVISLQYYMLLTLGSILRNQMFFIPWMVYYSFIITLEFVIFLMRTFKKGIIFNKHTLIISIFIVYNWLAIFCAHHHLGEKN